MYQKDSSLIWIVVLQVLICIAVVWFGAVLSGRMNVLAQNTDFYLTRHQTALKAIAPELERLMVLHPDKRQPVIVAKGEQMSKIFPGKTLAEEKVIHDAWMPPTPTPTAEARK